MLLYVTVRVTTSRTLTRLDRPLLASASQTLGEAVGKGEMAELLPESALFGERIAAGENGDWGMYRRGVRADCGRVNGDGGGMVMV